MKKIYTLLSMVLVGSVAVAQTSQNATETSTTKKAAMERAVSSGSASVSAARVDIYTEDFDGGLPGDWTVETVSGPCSWEWTDVGHQGLYPSPALESTSADNGWMILDSDLCGAEGGDSEEAYLTSPSIDLSEYDAVSVRFEQYFRRYGPAAEVTTLEVSIDGGNTWTAYEFNQNIDQSGTPNPDVAQVNISNIVGGESDVQFRFGWTGTWGYGWQIDDFAVFIPEDYNLTISETDYQNAWVSADEENYRDLAYTIYPLSQVRELNFRGTITNNGAVTQNNVALQVTIEGGDAPIVLTSDETVDLAPAESATFTISDWLPTDGVGTYNITYSTVQENEDSEPEDNEAYGSFQISEAEYARDLGVSQGEFSNFDDAHKVGTTYYMENEETLHCIGVALSSNSDPGTSYNLELLDAFDLAYISETEIAEVPADNLNEPGDSNWEWTPMIAPATLVAGSDYAVVLNHFGGEDLAMARLSGTSPAQTSFIYEGSEDTWYYITSTPMVRMGLSEAFCSAVTAVNELDQATVNELFPNPTAGQTTLEYSLLESAEVQLFLFDNMGRVVMNEDKGTQPVGEYRFDYDFSDLASGMYTFSIRVGDKAINKKLVIK